MSIGYTALHFKFPTVHNSLLFLFRLMPHSHESQCYPGSYGLGNKKRSGVLWDTGYWEITIRIYTVAPIKMRETSEFFLFVNVPAF